MTSNKFREFWDRGFKRLVSITPPNAVVSEHSTLFRRRSALGKAPGVRKADGEWIGFDWLKHQTTEADLDRWHDMGAGVGIRTGAGLVALDIDALDETTAIHLAGLAATMLGETWQRIGRDPKSLFLYRVNESVAYRRIKFANGLVELLSDDRQFVAHGIHPVTGRPYRWPDGLPPHIDEIPVVTRAQLDAYFARLATELPAAEPVEVVGAAADRATIDQGQLLGDLEDVTRAVAALPNSDALFPSYDDMIRVGAAIKGATQDEHEGLGLFLTWAEKWDGGTNEPEFVEAAWHRIKPPYGVGAQYLYSLAQQHGGFNTGDAWFKAGAPSTASVWDTAPVAEQPQLEPIRWIDPEAWEGVTPPVREWEVDGWIPRRQVTLLYGEGGIGKTLIIHQYAICAAAGIPWLGQKTRQARVMAILCEDDEDELQRRHCDLLRAMNVTNADLGGRLRLVSRTGENNLLAAVNRATGSLQPTPFYEQVRADTVAFRADVTVADTIADTFGGNEIDRGQVNAFIKTILGGLVKATGGSVLALGHPSVAGRAEGRSGSTAWSNAARSRIYLRYPKGVEKGNVRELEGVKANYGPKGALLKLAWKAGAFSVLAESKPIDPGIFEKSVAVPSVEDAAEAAVLRCVAQAWREQEPLSTSQRSTTYAPRILKRLYAGDLDGWSIDQVDAAFMALERRSLVVATDIYNRERRHRVTGYMPAHGVGRPDNMSGVAPVSVFS